MAKITCGECQFFSGSNKCDGGVSGIFSSDHLACSQSFKGNSSFFSGKKCGGCRLFQGSCNKCGGGVSGLRSDHLACSKYSPISGSDSSKNETNNLELEKDNYMIKELEKEKNEKIFIVHGRNNELKETIARFLETLELTPIILHEQPNQGKTIIEKLESHSTVSFAIVLMTPDDIGCLVNEENSANKYRARQNVVFELGYFIGKLGRPRVAIIVKGDIDILTDIIGVLYIEFENNDWKMKLAKEIKEAGYNIDLNKLIC
jgi:predicted nucleotide-binding protein